MNKQKTISAAISGEYGLGAAGCVILSAHNTAGFTLKQSVFQSLKKEKTGAVLFDDSRLAALGVIDAPNGDKGTVADHGTEKPVAADPLKVTDMLAASFILLAQHIRKPDPDNKGKKPEGLRAYLQDVDVVQASAVKWSSEGSDEAVQIKANCTMLKTDATPVLAMLRERKEKEFAVHFAPYKKHFAERIAEYAKLDTDDLIGVIESTLTDMGINPWKFAKDAAIASMDRQRKRQAAGLYTVVDVGVYTLSEA